MDRCIERGRAQGDQADGGERRDHERQAGHRLVDDDRNVPGPEGKIDDDMGDGIGQRRHADHPSHLDEGAPAEYPERRRYGQRHEQDRSRPHAGPIDHAAKRDWKHSVFTDGDLIGESDRRQHDEREHARLEPGECAIPGLPWPVQSQPSPPKNSIVLDPYGKPIASRRRDPDGCSERTDVAGGSDRGPVKVPH